MNFEIKTCKGSFSFSNDNKVVTITGNINDTVADHVIRYFAASPLEKRMSYSGSGLPFHNPEAAFFETINKGTIELGRDNYFQIQIKLPGSFYTSLGTKLIPPMLFIAYNNGLEYIDINIKIADPLPYRTLTYPSSRKDVMFYYGLFTLPVRSQDQILRDSGFPQNNTHNTSFWNLKPPM